MVLRKEFRHVPPTGRNLHTKTGRSTRLANKKVKLWTKAYPRIIVRLLKVLPFEIF